MASDTREAAPGLAVGVLGPLEVSVDGRPVAVRTGRLRALLAVLAMSAGRTVTVDQLAATMWDERRPAHVRRSVQTYVARLRGLLGTGAIGTSSAGYSLNVDPDEVDALRFLHLVNGVSPEHDPVTQRTRLARALALWRGPPFVDVPSSWLADAESARLVEPYLLALERRIDLDLAAGRHCELVAELSELVARHPLRESLWLRLLVVLDRCGRPAEALARYETIRARLADELGVEPGPELREVFLALLNGRPPEPHVDAPAPEPARPAPQQLPPSVEVFTGRRDELRRLDALLANTHQPGRTATTIVLVHGGAGVGKTSFAVHWAHRAGEHFPDGQLYVNLRGWDRTPPVDPAKALAGFLRALGEPDERIPPDPDEAAALFRTVTTDRRLLVVLDNARDVEQVRPLLPASAGCLVLVTSRNRLSGLLAHEGAHLVTVDVFGDHDAAALLAKTLPADLARVQPQALTDLARACAHLPLALRIASANLVGRMQLDVVRYVAELSERNPLDALHVEGDDAGALRVAFDLSYAALDGESQAMFRRLGLLIGPDITVDAAAALAGTTIAEAQRLLERLAEAALVVEQPAGRYRLHDLLRRYAAERAQADSVAAVAV